MRNDGILLSPGSELKGSDPPSVLPMTLHYQTLGQHPKHSDPIFCWTGNSLRFDKYDACDPINPFILLSSKKGGKNHRCEQHKKRSLVFPTVFKILISNTSIQIRATTSEWKAGAIKMKWESQVTIFNPRPPDRYTHTWSKA